MRTAIQQYVAIGKRMNQGIDNKEWLALRHQQLGIDLSYGFAVSKAVAKLFPSL
jgi:hypothetical protein